MLLNFAGNTREVAPGIEALSGQMGYTLGEKGRLVQVTGGEPSLQVRGENGEFRILYGTKAEFFRGLALLMDRLKNGCETFAIVEQRKFDTCGVMLDVSRNAVLKPETVKDIFRRMAAMGLNMAMLYMEDTYQIDDYPYFGYMRGAYSKEELRELDRYADMLGIELIPCIQTLAHLATTLRWQYADSMKDTPDILLIDAPETYRFIESMIRTNAECFRSRRIHVGMDEADMVGLGKYLHQNGYKNRFELLSGHLRKVTEIVEKYGLRPMMWNDMFFRLGSKTGAYRDLNAEIPKDIGDKIPTVDMVYWDYYTEKEDAYLAFLKKSQEMNRDVLFAGGIWLWDSIGVNYQKTFAATVPAMRACHKLNIREVFATIWQNDGAQVSVYTSLLGLQLFAEYNYYEDVSDAHLARMFKVCAGYDMEAFLLLQTDDLERERCQSPTVDVAKQVLYQDVLQGIFDANLSCADMRSFYLQREQALSRQPDQPGLEYLFEYQRHLLKVLAMKSNLGIEITRAYLDGDKSALRELIATLGQLKEEVRKLKQLAMDMWYRNNKPFGFDSYDLKLGGVLVRLDTAVIRLSAYVAGEVDRLEELEERRLPYKGQSPEMPFARASSYREICKVSI